LLYSRTGLRNKMCLVLQTSVLYELHELSLALVLLDKVADEGCPIIFSAHIVTESLLEELQVAHKVAVLLGQHRNNNFSAPLENRPNIKSGARFCT